MAVKLSKGQGVSLKKTEHDLGQITIGLGWDIAEEQPTGGFFAKLLGTAKEPEEYDLDVVAFLCGANGKVNDTGNLVPGRGPINGDIVFFNSMEHPSGQIRLTGDNRTGAGDGDDEQIIANLEQLPERYQKIVFVVQIYQGIERQQNFGKVKNAFIRAVDRRGTELARFDISGNASYANSRSLIFAELNREADGWQFKALGEAFATDFFGEILKTRYL